MLAVGIKVTAVSGTFTAGQGLFAWLVGSLDGGTTFFDLPYNSRLILSAAGTDVIAFTDKRNIADGMQATGSVVAIYQTLPADIIGLQYVVTGTTPQFTLGAWASGK